MSSQQGSKAQPATAAKAQAPAAGEELTGKCAYSNCQHEDDEKTTNYVSLKNTDYKFHNDCYGMWAVESRNMGRFSVEDRIKTLDEQKKAGGKK